MTTDEVLSHLKELGFEVTLGSDGQPKLKGDRKLVSTAMTKALAWHKEAIAKRLAPKPSREWLWRDGHLHVGWGDEAEAYHPVGAWWWRWQGETEWKPVPGRNPDGIEPPKGGVTS